MLHQLSLAADCKQHLQKKCAKQTLERNTCSAIERVDCVKLRRHRIKNDSDHLVDPMKNVIFRNSFFDRNVTEQLNLRVASRSWWEFKKRELALWVTG